MLHAAAACIFCSTGAAHNQYVKQEHACCSQKNVEHRDRQQLMQAEQTEDYETPCTLRLPRNCIIALDGTTAFWAATPCTGTLARVLQAATKASWLIGAAVIRCHINIHCNGINCRLLCAGQSNASHPAMPILHASCGFILCPCCRNVEGPAAAYVASLLMPPCIAWVMTRQCACIAANRARWQPQPPCVRSQCASEL
jgi:hypothetical protein